MANPMSPPTGGQNPGTGMSYNHAHSSQMAFAASKRAKVARVLGGKAQSSLSAPAAPAAAAPANFRDGLGHPDDVHAAIDGLAQAGHFTPYQAHALKSHQGPLVGQAGQATSAKIKTQMAVMSSQRAKSQDLA